MAYTSITLSGPIASGTSTAAKTLAEKHNLKYISAGDFFRQYVAEHNIPLYDKAKIPDNLDEEVDAELTELATGGGYVIDAHYIGYFTKDSPRVLKVLLTCDYEIRISRALSRSHTHQETEEEIKLREEGLDKKFRKLYADENYLNPEFFDLVVDTTNTQPEDVVDQITSKFSQE
ncbi:cytidylate kinase family protein [Candidatus Curtissbacteria bacterium]|nr:cytidylate kinase family protein [Candidatus Curtissbacteria bacterium]